MTCPGCGGALRVVVGPSDWTPWACDECTRGWFVAELDARDGWDPASRSMAGGERERRKVEVEYDAAHERGTSLREDQVDQADVTSIEAMANDERVDRRLRNAVKVRLDARPPKPRKTKAT